jgi:outer membrane biosynthesis protein TonB
MNSFKTWAFSGGLLMALLASPFAWADPGGDELGGTKEPSGNDNPPPKPSDELGGGEKEPQPAGGGEMPKRPDDLGSDEKPADTGNAGAVRGNDELGGGEPKEPPKEAPKEPPKEPPKEEPAKPPAADPPADPPPDDPVAKPPEPPEPGSVDEVAAQADARKKEDARINVLLAKFNSDMKKGGLEEQKRALTAISATKHRLVAMAMVPWIQPTVEEEIRDLAIEVAKGQRSPEIAAEAAKLFDKNMDKLKYARSMIGIIGHSKDVKQVAKLRSILKDKSVNLELQKEALIALGLIGHRDAIPDLIKMFKDFENPHTPKDEVARKNALQKLVEENLDLITGVHMPTGKGWDMWWKDNEKTFQKPPPGSEPPK